MNTTTQTPAKFLFSSMLDKYKAEVKTQVSEFINAVNLINDLSGLDRAYYRDLLPASKKLNSFGSLEEARAYLIKRKELKAVKLIESKEATLKTISVAGEIESIAISVEWKKSTTWGANPTATVEVFTSEGYSCYIGKASGCGYDKESAAVAQALNQSPAILKALYLTVKDSEKPIREILGYGSGYSKIFPIFEGGVGVRCHKSIFEAAGFIWKHSGSGKSFDVYNVVKK